MGRFAAIALLFGAAIFGVGSLLHEGRLGGVGVAIVVLSLLVLRATERRGGRSGYASFGRSSSRHGRGRFFGASRSRSSSASSWGKSTKSYRGGGGKFGGGGAKSKW